MSVRVCSMYPICVRIFLVLICIQGCTKVENVLENKLEESKIQSIRAQLKTRLLMAYTELSIGKAMKRRFSSEDLEKYLDQEKKQTLNSLYTIAVNGLDKNNKELCTDCKITDVSFKIIAYGNLDKDLALDIWTIDHNKKIAHVQDDLKVESGLEQKAVQPKKINFLDYCSKKNRSEEFCSCSLKYLNSLDKNLDENKKIDTFEKHQILVLLACADTYTEIFQHPVYKKITKSKCIEHSKQQFIKDRVTKNEKKLANLVDRFCMCTENYLSQKGVFKEIDEMRRLEPKPMEDTHMLNNLISSESSGYLKIHKEAGKVCLKKLKIK